MLVYIASPYSHKSKHMMKYREEKVSSIAAELTFKYRYTLFLPITQSARMAQLRPELFGHTFAAWKDIDLDAIDHSDAVFVVTMSGWKKSIGVQAEIKYAKSKKIPVHYVHPKTLKITDEVK